MKRVTHALPLAVVFAFLLSSCSMHLGISKLVNGGRETSAAKATKPAAAFITDVSIVNGKFRPKNATAKVGTTLTWTNKSDAPESVTSDSPGVFDSGQLAPGATWTYTFDKAGVFPYHSTGTPTSYGSVTVVP